MRMLWTRRRIAYGMLTYAYWIEGLADKVYPMLWRFDPDAMSDPSDLVTHRD